MVKVIDVVESKAFVFRPTAATCVVESKVTTALPDNDEALNTIVAIVPTPLKGAVGSQPKIIVAVLDVVAPAARTVGNSVPAVMD